MPLNSPLILKYRFYNSFIDQQVQLRQQQIAQVSLPLCLYPLPHRTLLAAATGADPRINENEWGEFLHLSNEKFYNFNKIRAEIVRDTEAKTGRYAGISPRPINLRIFSPNVLTLTHATCPD